MDTKWNDIYEKIREKIKENCGEKEIIMGISVIVMVCSAVLIHLLKASYTTGTVWVIGFFVNLILTAGSTMGMQLFLERYFQKHGEDGETGFEAWVEQWSKVQRMTRVVLAAFLLLAFCLFLVRDPDAGAVSLQNYAPNYLLFATVFLQYRVCRRVQDRWLKERVRRYVEQIRENSRTEKEEALAQALKIERESMEKVSRSDKLRMDLITNVSHDLKTPLTSVVGYLELLKKEELGDTAKDYLDVISRRVDKLKEMIESLFSLAKVSSGNVELEQEKLSMNRLIGQIFADMDDQIRKSGLEYIQWLCEEDTQIVTDHRYLYRICQNLMENTLKYSAKGTHVFVKTCVTAEDQVKLEITNTANYLMNFRKEDIVERFARGDAARTTEGNGLGLAIVSTYAEALGGTFDLRIDCDQFKAILLLPRGKLPAEL